MAVHRPQSVTLDDLVRVGRDTRLGLREAGVLLRILTAPNRRMTVDDLVAGGPEANRPDVAYGALRSLRRIGYARESTRARRDGSELIDVQIILTASSTGQVSP